MTLHNTQVVTRRSARNLQGLAGIDNPINSGVPQNNSAVYSWAVTLGLKIQKAHLESQMCQIVFILVVSMGLKTQKAQLEFQMCRWD